MKRETVIIQSSDGKAKKRVAKNELALYLRGGWKVADTMTTYATNYKSSYTSTTATNSTTTK